MGNEETGIGFVERKMTAERTARAYAMRQSRVRLEDSLSGPMLDAEKEIEKAFRAITEASYGNHDTARDISGLPIEEYGEWIAQQQLWLRDWTKACPSTSKGIVLDHMVFAFTFTDIADQRGITRQTVAAKYRIGLNEWCIMRGWGDQLDQN